MRRQFYSVGFGIALSLMVTREALASPTLTVLAQMPRFTWGSGLLIDPQGNIYSTNDTAGNNHDGAVFMLPAGSNTTTFIASISGNGIAPNRSALVRDANGYIYGAASRGGTYNCGTVYKMDPKTHAISTYVTFNNTDGAVPVGGLLIDAGGNLYGATQNGGAYGQGTVFKVDAATQTLSTLASFTWDIGSGTNNGSGSGDILAMDASGNIYGTTFSGTSHSGCVFMVPRGSNTMTKLASFTGSNGGNPMGGLVADAKGNLFGTTSDLYSGSGHYGTIFEITHDTHQFITIANFNGLNGSSPWGGLLIDSAGNLFGTAHSGGDNNSGTIFELPVGTHTPISLAAFSTSSGAEPIHGLTVDANGNLYGSTSGGGIWDTGTIFKLSDSGFVVPEPSSVGLLLIGTCCLMRRSQVTRR